MIDRVGQVWLGVKLEDEGDICLCVSSEPIWHGGHAKHVFLDLETGALSRSRESLHGAEDEWENCPGRRRLA